MAAEVWDRRLRIAQHALAAVTTIVAAVSILGWIIGRLSLASVGPDYVPMPPVNSILLFILCGTLIGSLHAPARDARARAVVLAVAGVGCLTSALELVDFFLGLRVAPDRLFVPRDVLANGVQIGRMSPVSAIALATLFVSLALLQYQGLWAQRTGVGFAVLVSAVGCVLLVGYLYNAPLLYGARLIPVAVPTAASLALIGVAIAGSGGTGRWPFSLLMDDSVRSQLMRGVLPVVMITTVAVAGLDQVSRALDWAQNPLAISAVFLLTFVAVTTTVIRSTELIGRRLGRAEIRRKRAEEERDLHEQHLETLVEERTADLVAANEELRHATAAKSDFLANMSHELRTPLNSIIGFTGVLTQGLAGDLNDEQRAQLNMVRRSGERLLALINDVLDLSRVESGRIAVQHSAADLAEVVTSAASTIRPLADQAGLRLLVEGVPRDVSLDTDEAKVHQVLVNLLANAVKFTAVGHVCLRVCISDPDTVVFEVEDTGVGVSAEDLDKIFEEFVQISSDGAKPEGTGLGLAISQRLVALLGGSLTARSVVGEGSTFVVTLPLVYRPAPPADEPAPVEEPAAERRATVGAI